MAANSAN